MATKQGTIDYILDQCAEAGAVSAKKMFGEYGLYCGGKLVGLVCDDQLFIKPTDAGRAFIGACVKAPAYPGAKPSLLIAGERWEDATWLSRLIGLTARALPEPAKRPSKTKKPA